MFNKGYAASHGMALSVQELDGLVKRVSEKINGGAKKMPQTVRVRVKNDREKRLKEYNKAAKRMKMPQFDISDFIKVEGNHRVFHIGDMERTIDAKVLKAMYMGDKSGYNKLPNPFRCTR